MWAPFAVPGSALALIGVVGLVRLVRNQAGDLVMV